MDVICCRPSAVVNLNCVTNRVAQGPRYKLSYDAEQNKTIHTLLNIPYLQPRTQPCDKFAQAACSRSTQTLAKEAV
jgi:hypothetical protein